MHADTARKTTFSTGYEQEENIYSREEFSIWWHIDCQNAYFSSFVFQIKRIILFNSLNSVICVHQIFKFQFLNFKFVIECADLKANFYSGVSGDYLFNLGMRVDIGIEKISHQSKSVDWSKVNRVFDFILTLPANSYYY